MAGAGADAGAGVGAVEVAIFRAREGAGGHQMRGGWGPSQCMCVWETEAERQGDTGKEIRQNRAGLFGRLDEWRWSSSAPSYYYGWRWRPPDGWAILVLWRETDGYGYKLLGCGLKLASCCHRVGAESGESLIFFVNGARGIITTRLSAREQMPWGSAEIVDVDSDSAVRLLFTLLAPRSIDVSHHLCGLDGAGDRG